ncbi:MAG: glycoside hydrolase family 13 protein [Acidimicrobiia bacterium]|nr:glycoside hydrolase family 13 protein [Acidimicrobiia bacterium]
MSEWWRDAVVYQVYIRSFADGNADGIGDIAGLNSKLEYIAELGVDGIWINPWYPSPLNDGGYDVADYRDVDERIGTLAAAEALVERAHSVGLKVLLDLVPNHTSSEHPWFVEALASEPGSAARSRYHFRHGRGDRSAPTNWRSVFGGPAWTRAADGQWYLHVFDPTQPDLNWDNPDVVAEFEAILRFWLDRGFDGFRVDVAHALAKDPTWSDFEDTGLDDLPPGSHPFFDRDELLRVVQRWRSVLDEYDGRMMVAEAVVPIDRLARYLGPDRYHQAFNFSFLEAGWDAGRVRSVIEDSLALGTSQTWVLSNHDAVRHATRFGLPDGVDAKRWLLDGPHHLLDPDRGLRRARAAALLMLALPGSAYVYQGEELGLPEVWDLPTDRLEDPIWIRSGRSVKGRDGCRVPMPWTEEGPSFGFGGPDPWLPQPEWFGRYSAERQANDASSTLMMYREALERRRQLGGGVTIVDMGGDVVAFRRDSGHLCVVNMGSSPVPMPPGRLVVASGDVGTGTLEPDTAVWIGDVV